MAQAEKVLVTGGAGYIGSHVCKALAEAGYEPVVYDNLSSGYADFALWGTFIHGDILDTGKLLEAIREHEPAGLIHFAACIEVGESVKAPGRFYRNNVGGTLSVLEAMRLSGLRDLVVSGSCAVYGAPESVPIPEHAPLRPVSPYGASKAMMERLLDDFEAAHGLHTAVMRYFNASGADPEGRIGERHVPETHLIPRVFMAAAGEIPGLALFGDDYPTPDGTCLRDYIHVNDLASAHILALEKLRRGARNLKINLGTGRGYSVLEIVAKSREITGKNIPCTLMPRRPGDSPALVGKVERAAGDLGWTAAFSSLENILGTAWNWFVRDRERREFHLRRAPSIRA
ncbi:MAG: UDP-glucose 4-epimerase GalE [Deltaproteobacteria bacterium]|nr:UDP-glucose 4-epimerase GalE [Deltaproteobacteria bacterium]